VGLSDSQSLLVAHFTHRPSPSQTVPPASSHSVPASAFAKLHWSCSHARADSRCRPRDMPSARTRVHYHPRRLPQIRRRWAAGPRSKDTPLRTTPSRQSARLVLHVVSAFVERRSSHPRYESTSASLTGLTDRLSHLRALRPTNPRRSPLALAARPLLPGPHANLPRFENPLVPSCCYVRPGFDGMSTT
jgi:hypothetical protein